MDRRAILRRCGGTIGGAGLLALAGCAQEIGHENEPTPAENHPSLAELEPELPVEERLGVMEEHIETVHDEEIGDIETMEEVLTDHALDIESLEREDSLLSLEYLLDRGDTERTGMIAGVGLIAGAYAAFIDGADETDPLDASVLEEPETELGSYYIPHQWAMAFNDDELTVAEYAEKVLETVESG